VGAFFFLFRNELKKNNNSEMKQFDQKIGKEEAV